MKQLQTLRQLFIAFIMLFVGHAAMAQTTASTKPVMKTYLIERDIPNAGKLTPAELKGIAQKSCGVVKEIGPQIEWVQSYVTGNKLYCVYRAENEALIREHGTKGGFPVTNIMEVENIFSPATATAKL